MWEVNKEPNNRQVVRVIKRAIYKHGKFFAQDGTRVLEGVEAWNADLSDSVIVDPKKREKAVKEEREDAREIR